MGTYLDKAAKEEEYGLRLSSVVLKIQWASTPTACMATRLYLDLLRYMEPFEQQPSCFALSSKMTNCCLKFSYSEGNMIYSRTLDKLLKMIKKC